MSYQGSLTEQRDGRPFHGSLRDPLNTLWGCGSVQNPPVVSTIMVEFELPSPSSIYFKPLQCCSHFLCLSTLSPTVLSLTGSCLFATTQAPLATTCLCPPALTKMSPLQIQGFEPGVVARL